MKKLFSIIMSMLMIACFMPAAAFAASATNCAGGEACKHAAAITDGNGTTHYDTLAKAIEAVQDGQTIEVLKDITGDAVVYDKAGVSATLDLKNTTFKATSNGNSTNHRVILVKNGTLTVKNGTLDSRMATTAEQDYASTIGNDSDFYGTVRASGGKLILSSLTLYNNHNWGMSIKADAGAEIKVDDCVVNSVVGGGLEGAGGTIAVRNSSFTQKGDNAVYPFIASGLAVSYGGRVDVYNTGFETEGNYALYVYNSGGTINVYGGTFSGSKECIHLDTGNKIENVTRTDSIVKVYGGTFTGNIGTGGESVGYENIVNITGGTFSIDPSDYVVDSSISELNDDQYVVRACTAVDGAVVAQVGSKYYKTLLGAIGDAKEGSTITLLKDYEVTTGEFTSYHMPDNSVLDLGNNTLTVPYAAAVFEGGNITIKNGCFASDANYGIWIGNGENETSATLKNIESDRGVNVFAASAVLEECTIDLSSHDEYYAVWGDNGNVEIRIKSGTYKGGSKAAAVNASDGYDSYGTKRESDPAKIMIEGGDFYGEIRVQDRGKNQKGEVGIAGGTFTTDPTAYLAKNYKASKNEGTQKWTVGKEEYTVTINPMNGNPAETKTIKSGETLTLEEPTRDGYDFGGWYKGTVVWTNGSAITSDTTLAAKWNKKTTDGKTTETTTTTDTKTDKDGKTTTTVTETVKETDESGVTVAETKTEETVEKTESETVTTKTVTKTTKVEDNEEKTEIAVKTVKNTDGETTSVEKTVTKESSGGTKTETKTQVEESNAKTTVKVEKVAGGSGAESETVALDATAATTNGGTEDENKTEVKKAEVTIGRDSAKVLNQAAEATAVEEVKVKTDIATLTIDNTALKTLTQSAAAEDNTKSLVLTVEKENQEETQNTNDKFILTAKLVSASGGEDGSSQAAEDVFKKDNKDSNGTIAISVNYAKKNARSNITVYYVENGKRQTAMPTTYKSGDGILTWTTDHFSEFEVVENVRSSGGGSSAAVTPPADDKADDTAKTDEEIAAENAAEAAELASALKLTARSQKTAKGNIKVTLTVDSDAVKAIEDLGYTVKYKFYRSTKKAASYKAKYEKADLTYTNTAGTKGTRYYYKARVMVYDAQGELIAKTALTQCKYACRIK